MHKTIAPSRTSAVLGSLHQAWAGTDQQTNLERCSGLQYSGCALWFQWEGGAWCLGELFLFAALCDYPLEVWLWHLLSQFIWQNTLDGCSVCEPWLQLGWGAAPGLQVENAKGKEPSYFSLGQLILTFVRAVTHTLSCTGGNEWVTPVTGVCLTERPLRAFL